MSSFGRFGIYTRTSLVPHRYSLAGVSSHLQSGKKRTRDIANYIVKNDERPAEWAEAHLVETGAEVPGYVDTLPAKPLFSFNKGPVPKAVPVAMPSGDGAAVQVSLF